jgi:hypothetical protein
MPTATGQPSTPAARPPRRSLAPHDVAVAALLEHPPEDIAVTVEQDGVVFILLPRDRPADEPAFMALALGSMLGNKAGEWALFAVADGRAVSLGTVEALSESFIRLFRAGPGTAVFRRFWFQMADPTPEETHKGSYEDLELTLSGSRTSRPETPIDRRTSRGRALWSTPSGDMYTCALELFRRTGHCALEKLSD